MPPPRQSHSRSLDSSWQMARVKETRASLLHAQRHGSWPRDCPWRGPFHSGPAQATPPPLCWSKPSRTPAESERRPAGRAWLRYVPRCFHPRQRIVVCGPMLACLSNLNLNGVVHYSFVAVRLPCLVCVAYL